MEVLNILTFVLTTSQTEGHDLLPLLNWLTEFDNILKLVTSSGLFMLFFKVYGPLRSWINTNKQFTEAQKKANILSLRYIITQACLRALKDGYIYDDDLEDLLNMYELYKFNGGNSYVTSLINKVDKLDVKVSHR